MRRALAGLVLSASLVTAAPAQAFPTRIVLASHHCRHECDDRGGGDGYGSGNGNSGGDHEGGRSGDNDQRGDHNCRNFCFYIPAPTPGQQPKSLVPPNPGKLGQQIADFVKLVSDFVQGVVRFAV